MRCVHHSQLGGAVRIEEPYAQSRVCAPRVLRGAPREAIRAHFDAPFARHGEDVDIGGTQARIAARKRGRVFHILIARGAFIGVREAPALP
jgi:hypothetical protein